MKILALEQERSGLPAEAFKPYLKAEATRVWELYRANVIREVYFRQDYHTAVLILECDSINEARQLLDTLPLVKAGLITFEVTALIPYDGFARMFAS